MKICTTCKWKDKKLNNDEREDGCDLLRDFVGKIHHFQKEDGFKIKYELLEECESYIEG